MRNKTQKQETNMSNKINLNTEMKFTMRELIRVSWNMFNTMRYHTQNEPKETEKNMVRTISISECNEVFEKLVINKIGYETGQSFYDSHHDFVELEGRLSEENEEENK